MIGSRLLLSDLCKGRKGQTFNLANRCGSSGAQLEPLVFDTNNLQTMPVGRFNRLVMRAMNAKSSPADEKSLQGPASRAKAADTLAQKADKAIRVLSKERYNATRESLQGFAERSWLRIHAGIAAQRLRGSVGLPEKEKPRQPRFVRASFCSPD